MPMAMAAATVAVKEGAARPAARAVATMEAATAAATAAATVAATARSPRYGAARARPLSARCGRSDAILPKLSEAESGNF
eukprot:509341-Prymnesium_polylepis.1